MDTSRLQVVPQTPRPRFGSMYCPQGALQFGREVLTGACGLMYTFPVNYRPLPVAQHDIASHTNVNQVFCSRE